MPPRDPRIASRYYTDPPFKARKTVAFDGTAGNGATGTVALFDITGEVMVAFLVPFCTEDLVEGGATAVMSLGVTGQVALFIANTEPEDFEAAEFWTAVAPSDVGGVALPALLQDILISADIILTIANDTVDDGTLEVTCYWWPLSDDGRVVAS